MNLFVVLFCLFFLFVLVVCLFVCLFVFRYFSPFILYTYFFLPNVLQVAAWRIGKFVAFAPIDRRAPPPPPDAKRPKVMAPPSVPAVGAVGAIGRVARFAPEQRLLPAYVGSGRVPCASCDKVS